MMNLSRIICALLSILILASCGKKSDKSKSNQNGDLSHNRHTQSHRPDKCHLQQIIDISENGKFILGLSLTGEDKNIEIFNIQNRKRVALINYFTYIRASFGNQNFVIKDESNQYKVFHLDEGNLVEKFTIPISPEDYPDFEFTEDGDHLLVRYRYSYFINKSRIQIYDIETGQVTFQWNERNVKIARLSEDKKFLFLGTEDNSRSQRKLMKINIEEDKLEFQINLNQKSSLHYLKVTKNRVIMKFQDTFFFLSPENGELLGTSKLFFLWSINQNGIAVGSEGFDDLMIFDTNSQEILSQMPKGLVVPSSCKIDLQNKVVCKTDERPDFFVKVNFEQSVTHNECL